MLEESLPHMVSTTTAAKLVHFRAVGMETVREILGKLAGEWNERLAGVAVVEREGDSGGEMPPQRSGARRSSHVRVELDGSAHVVFLQAGTTYHEPVFGGRDDVRGKEFRGDR